MTPKESPPPPTSGFADGVWGADGKTYCGPRNSLGSKPGACLPLSASGAFGSCGDLTDGNGVVDFTMMMFTTMVPLLLAFFARSLMLAWNTVDQGPTLHELAVVACWGCQLRIWWAIGCTIGNIAKSSGQ